MIELLVEDGIHVLRAKNGENRFNPDTVAEWNEALDKVERAKPAALVTTGDDRFFSNGLDLDWLARNGEHAIEKVPAGELLMRLLTFPAITVAAVNGHAFAAGGILALVHDFIVMRTDRGYFCLPEVDVKVPFSPSIAGIVRARLPPRTAHEAMVTGRRYTAEEARAAGFVHDIAPNQDVLSRAIALAAKHGNKDAKTLAAVKRAIFHDVLTDFARERTR